MNSTMIWGEVTIKIKEGVSGGGSEKSKGGIASRATNGRKKKSNPRCRETHRRSQQKSLGHKKNC